MCGAAARASIGGWSCFFFQEDLLIFFCTALEHAAARPGRRVPRINAR
jgi:hypothetical protein